MTHEEAHRLALDLMAHHGLIESGWRFRWTHGKRQLGSCRVVERRERGSGRLSQVKTIGLSKHLVALNPDGEVRETILHEIAHAIAGVKNGHNPIWKEACLKIGAKPQRLAGEEVKLVEARYAIVCGSCSRPLAQRHRRPNARRLAHSYCRSCGPTSKGSLRCVAPIRATG